MRKLEEIGCCPNCTFAIEIYKTSNFKRFAKCCECGVSYPLPKNGKIANSALTCPSSGFPILVVEKPHQKAYFWTDRPCFTCTTFDRCIPIKELIVEFEELEVHGY